MFYLFDLLATLPLDQCRQGAFCFVDRKEFAEIRSAVFFCARHGFIPWTLVFRVEGSVHTLDCGTLIFSQGGSILR
jgi:hypothetical protein